MKKSWPIVLLVISAAIAACSSSGGGSSSGDASSSANTANVAAAKAYVAPFLNPPTSIGVTQPLAKKPPTGLVVADLASDTPISIETGKVRAEAAKALGWTYHLLFVGTAPTAIQGAFQSALALNPPPNAIIEAGFPKASFATQLAQAKKKGIAVIETSTLDPAGTGDGIVSVIGGPPITERAGKISAAEVIADSGGNAHVAVFTIPAYPTLTNFTDAFKQSLLAWCPKCTVQIVNQQATDIGTVTPSSVVSTLQANPDINYAVFALGSDTLGVAPALKAAGLSHQVKIMGHLGSPPNFTAVKQGTEFAWDGFPPSDFGWQAMDAIARWAEHENPAVDTNGLYPTALITSKTSARCPSTLKATSSATPTTSANGSR